MGVVCASFRCLSLYIPLEIAKGYRGPIRMGAPLRKSRQRARVDGEVPLDASQFTFRQERIILADFYVRLWRELTSAVEPEDVPVWAAVFWGHLHNQPMNASKIANITGLPRTTIRGRLDHLVAQGKIGKAGFVYFIPVHWAKRSRQHPVQAMNQRIKVLIVDTAAKIIRLAKSAT
jgi:hypothetical protein